MLKKLSLLIALAALPLFSHSATFNLFGPVTGVLKGNASSYQTTAATSLDIRNLWGGTCDAASFLRGDGTCSIVSVTSFGNNWNWTTTSTLLSFPYPTTLGDWLTVSDSLGNTSISLNSGSAVSGFALDDSTATLTSGGCSVSLLGNSNEGQLDCSAQWGITAPIINVSAAVGPNISSTATLANATDTSVDLVSTVGAGNATISTFAESGNVEVNLGAGGATLGIQDNGATTIALAATTVTVNATNVRDAALFTSGTLGVARGGTNLTTSTDDNTMVGNGTTWESKAIPNCGSSTQALAYNTTTNAFSCQTVTGSGGAPGGSTTQVQYNNAGAFAGSAEFTWDGTYLSLTSDSGVSGAFFSDFGDSIISASSNGGGVPLLTIHNTNSGANAISQLLVKNNSNISLENVISSSGFSGSIGTSQFSGSMAALRTTSSYPLSIQTNNSERIAIAGDGSVVNLKATTVQVNGASITPSTGTFTATFDDACTTSPTMVFDYVAIGNMVTMIARSSSGFSCTSDSTGFATSGAPVPSAIRPTTGFIASQLVGGFVDNGANINGCIFITSGGNIQFLPQLTAGAACTGLWTSSGSKSAISYPNATISYILNDP